MAWNTGNSYVGGTAVTAALINGIGNDFRTWGGNVDAGGYSLVNCAGVTTNLLTILSGNLISIQTTANAIALNLSAAIPSGVGASAFLQAYTTTGVTSGDTRIGGIAWLRLGDITSGKASSALYVYVANDGVLISGLTIDNSGNATIAGGLTILNLPSTNPGAGSKQAWYDPSDGNTIKYAP